MPLAKPAGPPARAPRGPSAEAIEPRSRAPVVELRAVTARYPARGGSGRGDAPLEGVSVAVTPGEVTCVLGSNGAGKSTLLRVLTGALAPEKGEALLDGKPIAAYDRRAVARSVAVVSQVSEVAFGFTVRDVVMMGRAPHQDGWLRASDEDDEVVRDALVRCDLVRLADVPAAELSGGEQKRVAIARALAQRPRALLLDEPGAFLDVRHQLELHDLLADEVARGGLACLVVLHDLNLAAQYASCVVLMKAGRVIASGAVAEVMTHRRLLETFGADLYVGVNDLTGARFFLPMRQSGGARSG